MSHQTSDIITPKALLLDEQLTPLERNAWLTFRALASSDGTVVLSYDAPAQRTGQQAGCPRNRVQGRAVPAAVHLDRLGRVPPQSHDRLLDGQPLCGAESAARVRRRLPGRRRLPAAAGTGARPRQRDDPPTGAVHSRRGHAPSRQVGKAARNNARSGACNTGAMTMIREVLVVQLRAMPSCPKPATTFRNPLRHPRQQYVL